MSVTLVLTHDLDLAKKWLSEQDAGNPFILDERELVQNNIKKFGQGFLDINYSTAMVEYMQFMRHNYKASRPLVILMDMQHYDAVDKIKHDVSVLFYDNSKNRRLNYHTFYKTNYAVNRTDDYLLEQIYKGLVTV